MPSNFETEVRQWMAWQLSEMDVHVHTVVEDLIRITTAYFDLFGCEPAQQDVVIWAHQIWREQVNDR